MSEHPDIELGALSLRLHPATFVRFSPNGRSLALSSGSLWVHDLPTRHLHHAKTTRLSPRRSPRAPPRSNTEVLSVPADVPWTSTRPRHIDIVNAVRRWLPSGFQAAAVPSLGASRTLQVSTEAISWSADGSMLAAASIMRPVAPRTIVITEQVVLGCPDALGSRNSKFSFEVHFEKLPQGHTVELGFAADGYVEAMQASRQIRGGRADQLRWCVCSRLRGATTMLGPGVDGHAAGSGKANEAWQAGDYLTVTAIFSEGNGTFCFTRNGEKSSDFPVLPPLSDGCVMPMLLLPAHTVCSINTGADDNWAFRYPPGQAGDTGASLKLLFPTPQMLESRKQYGQLPDSAEPLISSSPGAQNIYRAQSQSLGDVTLKRNLLPPFWREYGETCLRLLDPHESPPESAGATDVAASDAAAPAAAAPAAAQQQGSGTKLLSTYDQTRRCWQRCDEIRRPIIFFTDRKDDHSQAPPGSICRSLRFGVVASLASETSTLLAVGQNNNCMVRLIDPSPPTLAAIPSHPHVAALPLPRCSSTLREPRCTARHIPLLILK